MLWFNEFKFEIKFIKLRTENVSMYFICNNLSLMLEAFK